MKNITKGCFQGDVAFRRVNNLPDNAKEEKQTNSVIVAHSETGHHHAIDNIAQNVWFYSTPDPMLSYVKVRGNADVVHYRDFDTHETIRLDSGDEPEVIWEIRRQEEFTPEGWRRIED